MANLNSALAAEVDAAALEANNKRVDDLATVVREMVNNIVNELCKDLDEYMHVIDTILQDSNTPVSDEELEDFTLNLPSLLYLVSSKREDLRIREDVARAIHKDVYNRVREKAKGTIADKDTAADLAAQSEAITVIVLQRAGTTVKAKEDAAWEMLNSVKKVLSRRVEEIRLSSQTGG